VAVLVIFVLVALKLQVDDVRAKLPDPELVMDVALLVKFIIDNESAVKLAVLFSTPLFTASPIVVPLKCMLPPIFCILIVPAEKV